MNPLDYRDPFFITRRKIVHRLIDLECTKKADKASTEQNFLYELLDSMSEYDDSKSFYHRYIKNYATERIRVMNETEEQSMEGIGEDIYSNYFKELADLEILDAVRIEADKNQNKGDA